MLSLSRSGPEGLILHATEKVAEIRDALERWGSFVDMDPERALSIYGANRRVVFFISPYEAEEETSMTYVSENLHVLLLMTLVNERLISGVESIKMLPGFIMMRLIGDIGRGMEAIRRDLGGEIIERDPLYHNDIPGTSSIIYFTDKSLVKFVPRDDMYEKALVVHDRSKGAIIQFLTMRGTEYLSDSLGTPDWNDMEIKIYDANGWYDLHRERLWVTLQGLQAGLALEERWGKDQAFILMSVPVYRVRILTPIGIRDIKRIAMGLEYNGRGNRFADFDVFHNDRKISAYQELEGHPGLSRNAVGMIYRNDIIKNLDSDSRNKLLNLEDCIRVRTNEKKHKFST